MSRSRKGWVVWIAAAVAAVAVLVWANDANAQKRVSLDGHGGIAFPTGRFADIAKSGPTMGLQMSYPMSQRTSFKVTGDVDELDGARLGAARAPDMRVLRAGIGLDREIVGQKTKTTRGPRGVVRRTVSPWTVVGSVGVGATRFDSEAFTTSGSSPVTREFRETYLATDVGLTVRYRASERVQLRAGTHGNLAFADRAETAILAGLDPEGRARAFGSAVTVPVSVGFTIRM